jgi:glycosyltransferase involved in cell wall biosynthesis
MVESHIMLLPVVENSVPIPVNPGHTKPVLAYAVTEDWYFLLHRLPMARAAKRAGYDVHVITNVNKGAAAIQAEGFHLHRLAWRRGSLNPFGFFLNILALRRIYRAIVPAIVHHVALQAAIVGSLAAMGLPPVRLNAFTGFGFVFTSKTAKAILLRPFLRVLLRIALRNPLAAVLVENPDDRTALQGFGVAADKITIIPGSGVEIDQFVPLPEPEGPIVVGFVGRLLDDKGIRALVQAHDILVRRGAPTRLLIAGAADPANPASIPPQEINSWAARVDIEMLGYIADIRKVWERAHIAVLPSRREGLPTSLLEAAACGRPIVATDVPGCREIARPGVNALLVPPDDAVALANAIALLAQDRDQRLRFGAAGRQLVEKEFSATKIGKEIVALYNRLVMPASIRHGQTRPRFISL